MNSGQCLLYMRRGEWNKGEKNRKRNNERAMGLKT
jgi:hypothetical protein